MKSISYIEDFDQWKRSFLFSIQIKVRFSETDMFGHVNNVSAFTYFEEARIEYLKSLGFFSDSSDEQNVPVVADLQCDYHQQMYFDDRLNVYVKAHYIGTTSVDIHYMVVNEKEDLCLTGRGRLVYINKHSGKPVAIDENLKEKLLVR
ncbi:uncharacterized protein JNUCC1_03272 [Lentibacillus sp. JNUCC-1]|uniref:acyl-CoA thioesterase n=1 Tax=Lentibacillus sp. JNUCC-1 TaxID=2654513 RepID=UPI001321C71E|nr:uncharacterized protein [Lentibacillus sp. JNUCC-1]